MFTLIEIPFAMVVRNAGSRYSFINYNFVFRRFFDLLSVPHFSRDFPPLKSRKKREDCCWFWVCITNFLRWPYINNDGEIFGDEYAVDIRALTYKRTHSKRRVGRANANAPASPAATYTGPRDIGLRRRNAIDEGAHVDEVCPDEAVFNVFDTLACIASLHWSGLGNDDSDGD